MQVCEVVRIDQSCIWVYIRDLYYVIVLIIILDEIQFLLEDFLSSSRVCYSLLCVCFRTSLCFFTHTKKKIKKKKTLYFTKKIKKTPKPIIHIFSISLHLSLSFSFLDRISSHQLLWPRWSFAILAIVEATSVHGFRKYFLIIN